MGAALGGCKIGDRHGKPRSNVDRHCELNSASPAARADAPGGTKASSPRCTPPGDFTRDHGLAAGLLARRSVPAAAFPRAKAPSGIVAENSLLTVAGAAVALCVNARTTFPFDPLREPPRLEDDLRPSFVKRRTARRRQLLVAVTSAARTKLNAAAGIWDNCRGKPHKRRL